MTNITSRTNQLVRAAPAVEPQQFALYRLTLSIQQIEQGKGKRDEWVFHTANQKWDKNMIKIYSCKKNMKVIVWGCFWNKGRTSLYIMDRDFESLKHGYSANSYLEVLNVQVNSWYQTLDSGYIFMQDIASIHTAKKVKKWFASHGIEVVADWPSYSPDLNPICWKLCQR